MASGDPNGQVNFHGPRNQALNNSRRALQCLKRVFAIHSDTVNIWSHFAAFLFFAYRGICHELDTDPRWENSPRLTMHHLSYSACFLVSAIYHTFRLHSVKWNKILSEAEIIGTKLAITETFLTWAQYMFPERFSQSFYPAVGMLLNLIKHVLGIGALTEAKLAVDLLLHALLGLIPAICFALSFDSPYWVESVCLVSGCIIFGISAAVVYVSHVPERYFPGTFNVWFHSHQIMHVLVFASALCDHYGLRIYVGFLLKQS